MKMRQTIIGLPNSCTLINLASYYIIFPSILFSYFILFYFKKKMETLINYLKQEKENLVLNNIAIRPIKSRGLKQSQPNYHNLHSQVMLVT